jgi:hypothetical protein
MSEVLIAMNYSSYHWEYDNYTITANLYLSDNGSLRLKVDQKTVKTGLGAGTFYNSLADDFVGDIKKPNLSLVRTILKKHQIERSRAGAPFRQVWIDKNGKERKLAEILLEEKSAFVLKHDGPSKGGSGKVETEFPLGFGNSVEVVTANGRAALLFHIDGGKSFMMYSLEASSMAKALQKQWGDFKNAWSMLGGKV